MRKLVPMKMYFSILSSIGFVHLLTILILIKTNPYSSNLSSLIGIWKGFADLNPNYIPEGFIVFHHGGYDGQFFFLLSRYLYESGLDFPILDSFYFRFHRLGLSIISGFLSSILGFEYYPIATLSILSITHIMSYFFLLDFLPHGQKHLSIIYLFNPYSLLGILLLVSDPLLISIGVIASVIVYRVRNLTIISGMVMIIGMILFSLSLSIRETSLFIIAPVILVSTLNKEYFKIAFILPSIILYTTFLGFLQFWEVPHPGTLPLKFIDMIDYPLVGFINSLEFGGGDSKQWIRESIKILLFILYLQLGLNLYNPVKLAINYFKTASSYPTKMKYLRKIIIQIGILIPIASTFGLITIAEQGYWRSFDNLTRMFTITVPFIILAKAYFSGYNDFGFLPTSVMLTVFILIRVLWITKPMGFNVY